MEGKREWNSAHLAGKVLSEPVFSHKSYGEAFYVVTLGVLRKSGCQDKLRLVISDHILGGRSPQVDELIEIAGQIRTYNREVEGRSRLEITVFVRELKYCGEEEFTYINQVSYRGFLCKEPIHRSSPLGREICDLMIAVNRMYNKSDYIPSIAWGRNALYASGFRVGDQVSVEGRLQSRDYRKFTDEGYLVTKTAYEVSVTDIKAL